jgi:hypothetical protein
MEAGARAIVPAMPLAPGACRGMPVVALHGEWIIPRGVEEIGAVRGVSCLSGKAPRPRKRTDSFS